MTYFKRIAAYTTSSRRRGHVMELTAKLAGNRIVFAGGNLGNRGIDAAADIRAINDCWKVYCAAHDANALDGVPEIERSVIDTARQK